MDLEVARKALSKRSKFSPKRVAFFIVAGLCLVAGILLRSGQYFAQPEVELKAPVAVAPSPPPVAATPAEEATEPVPEAPPPAQDTATAPTENVEPTGKAVEAPEQAEEAVENAEQPEPSDSARSWFPGSLSRCWQVRLPLHPPCMAFRLVGPSA